MSLADELLADLDDIGDELGNEENDQVSLPYVHLHMHALDRYLDCVLWLHVYT